MPSCFGKQVKEYVLGKEVTSIGTYAFYDSNELVSVNIPSNVTSIGDSAFYNCSTMTDMYCYAGQVPETGKDVFVSSNYTNATLHVPANSIEAYSNTGPWKNFGNIVALTDDDPKPSGIKRVTNDMMAGERYYSLDGKLTTTPRRGLYIKDGKKVVIK